MFTLRSLGGIALLLTGSTWRWLTPAFASRGVSTPRAAWTLTRVLALPTVLGFTVATVGLFSGQSWWEDAAFGSALLGVLALIAYWIASDAGGETAGTPAWTVVLHASMLGGVMVLLTVPALEQWVNQQLTG